MTEDNNFEIPKPLEKNKSISDAETFEELYDILDKMKSIQGSQQRYTAEELKNAIEDDRKLCKAYEIEDINKMLPSILSEITRTSGLREKVKYLFKKEFKL